MNKLLLSLYFFCTTLVFGQRLYFVGGPSLMPPGYSAVSFLAGAGVEFDRPYLVFDSFAGYDNGRKDNDNDNAPNSQGHDRYLRGFAGYKCGSWYAGGGARWNALYTPDYNDYSWHPEAGVGRDWGNAFVRTQAAYMFQEQHEVTRYPGSLTCHGCGSGSRGADITIWLPSPASNHRFFMKTSIVVFHYHTTITEPNNIALTKQQTGERYWGDSTEFMFGFRW